MLFTDHPTDLIQCKANSRYHMTRLYGQHTCNRADRRRLSYFTLNVIQDEHVKCHRILKIIFIFKWWNVYVYKEPLLIFFFIGYICISQWKISGSTHECTKHHKKGRINSQQML